MKATSRLFEELFGTRVIPEERRLVTQLVLAVRARQIDATHTAEEKLFGKDDDAGNPIEPGVLTREQVAVLAGVHSGVIGVEALDALLPDSGKPEAVTPAQMVRTTAFVDKDILGDIVRVMRLRKEARGLGDLLS